MNLRDKLARVREDIRNITGHVDADAFLRKAALDSVIEMAQTSKCDIDTELKSQADSLVNPEN